MSHRTRPGSPTWKHQRGDQYGTLESDGPLSIVQTDEGFYVLCEFCRTVSRPIPHRNDAEDVFDDHDHR